MTALTGIAHALHSSIPNMDVCEDIARKCVPGVIVDPLMLDVLAKFNQQYPYCYIEDSGLWGEPQLSWILSGQKNVDLTGVMFLPTGHSGPVGIRGTFVMEASCSHMIAFDSDPDVCTDMMMIPVGTFVCNCCDKRAPLDTGLILMYQCFDDHFNHGAYAKDTLACSSRCAQKLIKNAVSLYERYNRHDDGRISVSPLKFFMPSIVRSEWVDFTFRRRQWFSVLLRIKIIARLWMMKALGKRRKFQGRLYGHYEDPAISSFNVPPMSETMCRIENIYVRRLSLKYQVVDKDVSRDVYKEAEKYLDRAEKCLDRGSSQISMLQAIEIAWAPRNLREKLFDAYMQEPGLPPPCAKRVRPKGRRGMEYKQKR